MKYIWGFGGFYVILCIIKPENQSSRNNKKLTWFHSTHIPFFFILDDSECCPLGLLKSQFSPNRLLRFPLSSFFHPFVISVFPPLAMPNMWRRDCGRTTCQISEAFGFSSSLCLSTSIVLLWPQVYSCRLLVATIHIYFLKIILTFLNCTFSPLLIPTRRGHMFSPVLCHKHTHTHAGRRQTET